MPAFITEAIFWTALVLCCGAQAALLHSFFRGGSRVRAGAAAGFRATETLWAVLPAIVLAGLLVATWQTMRAPVTVQWTPGGPIPAALAPEARP